MKEEMKIRESLPVHERSEQSSIPRSLRIDGLVANFLDLTLAELERMATTRTTGRFQMPGGLGNAQSQVAWGAPRRRIRPRKTTPRSSVCPSRRWSFQHFVALDDR